MIRIGVIGCGYWGPNLIRCFSEAPGSSVEMVCDLRADRLAPLRKRYSAIQTTASVDELLANPRVDAVAIATPGHRIATWP